MTATRNVRTPPKMKSPSLVEGPPRFLILSGSYSHLSLALSDGEKIIATHTAENVRASAHLLPLLQQHIFSPTQSTIHDIDCIAVDAGPGAFTSLRVLLATVNGLALAAKKPVISCDGIAIVGKCLAAIMSPQQQGMVLFNAYNNELYYCNVRSGDIGYLPLDDICTTLNAFPEPVVLAGQGVAIYEEQLRAAGVDLSSWQHDLCYPPVEALAHDALLQWEDMTTKVFEAQPLHLKEQRFKKMAGS